MAAFGPGDLNGAHRPPHATRSAATGSASAKIGCMKRGQRWSAAKKADDSQPGSEGGPLRRRRDLRHLDSLALDPGRELNPATATAHVRVIGDSADSANSAGSANSANSAGPEGRPNLVPRRGDRVPGGAPPSEDRDDERPAPGTRVQAVPIDQPLGAESAS